MNKLLSEKDLSPDNEKLKSVCCPGIYGAPACLLCRLEIHQSSKPETKSGLQSLPQQTFDLNLIKVRFSF